MYLKLICPLLIGVFGFCLQGQAQVSPLQYFQSESSVELPSFDQINRVSVSIEDEQKYTPIIWEATTGKYQPFVQRAVYMPNNGVLGIVENSKVLGNRNALIDKDFRTSAEFDFDGNGGRSQIVLKTNDSVDVDRIGLYLDSNVKTPERVKIEAKVEGGFRVVLAERENYSNEIVFPSVRSSEFKIELVHTQPLRIQEIEVGKPTNTLISTDIIWLARAGEIYKIYYNGVKEVNAPVVESGNLLGIDDKILTAKLGDAQNNPEFKELDEDRDGIIDKNDNCPEVSNKDQKDLDGNKKGDLCDDRDGDSVLDGKDNCPLNPNRAQVDSDRNSKGDVCEDGDSDGYPDGQDNCPATKNVDQKDQDVDGVGDQCDNGESRFLVKYPYLPWIGLMLSFGVVSALTWWTIKSQKKVPKV